MSARAERKALPELVREALRAWAGFDAPADVISFVQLVGNPSSHGKAVFIVLVSGGPVCVLKLARNDVSASYMRNEKEALQALARTPMSRHLPALRGDGMVGGTYFTMQDHAGLPLLSRGMERGNVEAIGLELLSTFCEASSEKCELTEENFSRIFREPVSRFKEMTGAGVEAANLLSRLEKDLPRGSMVLTGRHGDFWPGNVMMKGGVPIIIDWDFASRSCIPFYDAFYYMSLSGEAVDRWDIGARLEKELIENAGGTFAKLGPLFSRVGQPQALAPAFLCLFAIEAALKQMDLSGSDIANQFVLFSKEVDGLAIPYRDKIMRDTFPRFARTALSHFFG
jgi:hypothetical protein